MSKPCRFCALTGETYGAVHVVFDKYPVTYGHALILPARHIVSWFDATPDEWEDLLSALIVTRHTMLQNDDTVTGFNVGINDGTDAGQTVMHAHTHLIPRRPGDMDDPAGGVRGVIPSMQKYGEVTA